MEENGRSGNTDRPDEEGIKTHLRYLLRLSQGNTDRPDEEGIKTQNAADLIVTQETQTDLMKKGLRR